MSKSVAIVGITGYLGKPTLEALLEPTFRDNFKLPVRAVTRKAKETSNSEVEYYEASDLASYEKAFQGIDVVIDLRSTAALGSTDIALAAKNAGVKVLVPSEFGLNYSKAGQYQSSFQKKKDIVQFAEKQGLKVIQFHVGYFIDSSLAPFGDSLLFFNGKTGTSDYVGDGTYSITFNSIKNIGQSVAAVLKRPYDEIPDVVNIAGNNISPADFIPLYEKYTGKKLIVKPSTIEDITKAADDAIAGKSIQDSPPYLNILRAITVINNEAANFSSYHDNEFVNPGQKYFKWETVEDYIPKAYP